MKPCKEHNLRSSDWNKRFWFHDWRAWQEPITTVYKGVQTLVQLRRCHRCEKVQAREC
jgi:hypothetical protein